MSSLQFFFFFLAIVPYYPRNSVYTMLFSKFPTQSGSAPPRRSGEQDVYFFEKSFFWVQNIVAIFWWRCKIAPLCKNTCMQLSPEISRYRWSQDRAIDPGNINLVKIYVQFAKRHIARQYHGFDRRYYCAHPKRWNRENHMQSVKIICCSVYSTCCTLAPAFFFFLFFSFSCFPFMCVFPRVCFHPT